MTSDLIIIGSGPGGYECAVKAAAAGLQVTIIEAHAVGGTCLNEGCIPTKCLCREAELLENIKQASRHGIFSGEVSLDFPGIMARKNEVVGKLADGIRQLMKTPGITFVEGTARFVDAKTIEVNGAEYTAPNVIIATGSVASRLPIEGADHPKVVTSSEVLNLSAIPASLCVIGGGVIGLEFASIFRSFGTEVTVIEYCKEILPNFDQDVAKRLRLALKKRGIAFKTGAAVTKIETAESGLCRVLFDTKNSQSGVEAELVLMAVGRKANVGSLNLADVGIAFSPKGIEVDDNLQTNVPGIYAVGDVNGRLQLAHAATYQSFRALNHILGKTDGIRLDIVPAAVFTNPEVASVGLTEEMCKERGVDYKVQKAFYRANGKALAMDEDEGLVKLLSDSEGYLLGAHILGAHAADLVHEASLLMNLHGKVSQLHDAVHAHPTLSELFVSTN